MSPNEDADAELNHRARRQALKWSNSNLAKACRALGPTEFDEWKMAMFAEEDSDNETILVDDFRHQYHKVDYLMRTLVKDMTHDLDGHPLDQDSYGNPMNQAVFCPCCWHKAHLDYNAKTCHCTTCPARAFPPLYRTIPGVHISNNPFAGVQWWESGEWFMDANIDTMLKDILDRYEHRAWANKSVELKIPKRGKLRPATNEERQAHRREKRRLDTDDRGAANKRHTTIMPNNSKKDLTRSVHNNVIRLSLIHI